jgi:ferredoxin-NADP reductase
MLDRQVDFWLSEIRPVWSLRERRARVVDILDETHDVKTFVLALSALSSPWPRAQAGQYLPIDVEIEGRRVRRFYSISSAPHERHLSITVKRVEGGKVSSWLHDRVRPGDILVIGEPAGEFVVPASAAPELLFVTGGSGVTPAMSILRDLAARDEICDVVFVVCARSRADGIFDRELREIAAKHAGLRLVLRYDEEAPLLDARALRDLVPDLEDRLAFLCGPAPMMAALAPIWEPAHLTHRLRSERFVSARPPVTASEIEGETKAKVRLTVAGRDVDLQGPGTLLEQLERAGETPVYGCRMGICNTCRCRKTSGITEDITTGALSDANEEIRLCVSIPRSDLDLSL